MRSIKELLIITRNCIINKEPKLILGLCWYIIVLQHDNIITKEERIVLNNYFEKNIPLTYLIIKNTLFRHKFRLSLWWREGNKKPRIRYLNKHIKKQKL